MKLETITPQFVRLIPAELEHGILYISKEFKTAIHLCACGCGKETVTPLQGELWSIIEVNGLITLRPSIGNFNIPCKSHYFITDNKIEWV